ncbi:MAG: hypothetical protein PHY09_18495 [Desulfuromonadaceae bacterium]|nr:hypothetical protein [Desulfuromonadaceae bacterium]MDD5107595.1 hypothetical protein [Desulfuromonadaceae bacterium]
MLLLKLALDECGIKQKVLCDATGFGKTQVSLTLSTGKLPANADKFLDGVNKLVAADNRLTDWLVDRGNLSVHSLCDIISEPGQVAAPIAANTNPALNGLECLLYEIAGRAALAPDDSLNNKVIIMMAQATIHMRRKMAAMVGHDAPWTVRTEAEAAAILTGGPA